MGEDSCSEKEGQVIPFPELISCFRSDQTDLLFNGSGGPTFGAFENKILAWVDGLVTFVTS